jgi:hypothetical protein
VDASGQGSDPSLIAASVSDGSIAATSSQPLDASSVENSGLALSNRAQKKIDKMQCLKCNDFGHFADACTAVLCIYCEKISHESKNCPLLSMPKPVAISYGVARNELLFHEVPASNDVTFKHDSGKVGKISVNGGILTASEIIKELHWIISDTHQWDLTPTDDGSFKAIFPSKSDLARMTKIINVPVPDTSMFLHFEEWSAAELDRFCVTPVWVRVHGVCYKERCDYLSLFGVGSLIGKTKEVDMVFTRAHTTVRMLVEVTRVEYIPTTTVDHMYDGQGYGLLFKLENQPTKEKEDVVMNESSSGDDANKDKGQSKEMPTGTDSFGTEVNPTPKQKQDPPRHSSPQNKQVQGCHLVDHSTPKPKQYPSMKTPENKHFLGCSLPAIKVGQIDCPRVENINAYS